MFIGHFGLSLAAKKSAPGVSLTTLFLATQFADILWPIFLMTGIEKVSIVPGFTKTNAFDFTYYPYSHSLMMSIIWAALVGGVYYLIKKEKREAFIIGLCVASHWFMDVIVHVEDMPLSPFNEIKVGLGLWNHVLVTLILESIIFLVGTYIYTTITKASNWKGSWGLWTLILLLFIIDVANTFGPPPPPSIVVLFFSAVTGMGFIIGLAYWLDKNRSIV